MKKTVLKIGGLFFLALIVFAGCGSKEKELENTLTEGTGIWTFVTKAGEGKIVFFEDGTAKVDDDGEVDATYKINEDGTEMKMKIVDSDVYTTMKSIEMESDKVIKGEISKNGKANTEPFKLVK
ncbi:hypothetical protein FQS87_08250 [Enterococcus avium]|uniref:hypothetical protein n=1 Tax=Enterococcus TaxID=1350 RepID=UPI001A96FB9C|nr:hypothetical protein [Enterococcus avium]MBO1139886.1 hypothetical protein [Enterococcus avium]